jgi:hypothetical protein
MTLQSLAQERALDLKTRLSGVRFLLTSFGDAQNPYFAPKERAFAMHGVGEILGLLQEQAADLYSVLDSVYDEVREIEIPDSISTEAGCTLARLEDFAKRLKASSQKTKDGAR